MAQQQAGTISLTDSQLGGINAQTEVVQSRANELAVQGQTGNTQNALPSISDLFIQYADTIDVDNMPTFAEFERMYNKGGAAWDELTLKMEYKQALRSGEIEPFTRFKEYKAMVDGQGESGYNNKGFSISDNVLRTDEVTVEFNYNGQHDEPEFARQLKNQETGMNQLTIEEYLRNRERYNAEGRSVEGNASQHAYRAEAYSKKINELREKGLSYGEAKIQAKLWMDSQAVLHNPDQIAGGNPLTLGGMGDAGVNSSIGAQWKYRISTVDEYVNDLIQSMSEEEIMTTYLNIRLIYFRR